MQVQSLGQEDSLEECMALQYSCLENPHGQRSLAGYGPQGHTESDMAKATQHARTHQFHNMQTGLKHTLQGFMKIKI